MFSGRAEEKFVVMPAASFSRPNPWAQKAYEKNSHCLLREGKPGVKCLSVYNSFGSSRPIMIVQFLLFVIAVLLILVFWELSKINSRLKKTLVPHDIMKDSKT